MQPEPVWADQEEQLPGVQPDSDPEVCAVTSPMSAALAEGEYHSLWSQTCKSY